MLDNRLYEYYVNYTLENTKLVVLDKTLFNDLLVEDKIYYVTEHNSKITGFISGVISGNIAYMTILYGNKSSMTELVHKFEASVLSQGIKKVWFHFFNPVGLRWMPLIDVYHPSIQGVVLNSETHVLLNELGYIDNSVQDTYYRDLSGFMNPYGAHPNSLVDITVYNKIKHSGLLAFIEKMNNPGFGESILNNESKDEPLPLIVATYNNEVIGFTGPIKVTSDLRGYFAGIQLLDEYQGQKIGTYLFFKLCELLKSIGAKYMTLFTGRNNLAKYVYKKAGFEVVESFITLKKELKE